MVMSGAGGTFSYMCNTATATYVAELMRSKKLHSLKIWKDRDELITAVNSIVLQDDNKRTSREGLDLLKDSLDEADTIEQIANVYNIRSKRFYQIQRSLGLSVNFCY
eukprot:846216_1